MPPIGSGNHETIKESGGFITRHYSEEEWIDWMLGNIKGRLMEDMRLHLGRCPACREIAGVWGPLLADTEPPAAPLNQQTRQHPDFRKPLLPADPVRRSLRRRVRIRGWRRAIAGMRPVYRRGAAALAGLAFIALVLAGLYGIRDGDTERTRYVTHYDPEALSVISRPDTVSLPLDRDVLEPFTGNIWYNDASGELFVLIEDPALSDSQTLQAWAVKNGERNALGLIQVEAAKGHLYVKDGQLGEADNFALTVEPIGGSQSPTSPDAVRVRLLHP